MSNIDEQFIEYIVKSLVGKPDAVKIDRRIDEKGVLLELTVDPEDLGRVIGKRGATAQSLRTLLRALGTKNEARYNLKIVDNGEPRPARDYSASTVTPADDQTSSQSNSDDNDEVADEKPVEAAKKVEASKEDDFDFDDRDESGASDRLSKTRKELDDLDDLDI